MSVAAKTRENTASVTTEHKFLGENRGNLGVKKLDGTVRPLVREKSGHKRYERDYMGLQRTRVEHPAWPSH